MSQKIIKMEILKIYLKTNENENTHLKHMGCNKTILGRKFIAINVSIKEEERSKIKNLM